MRDLPFPVRDANAGGGADDLGNLPEWDLTDLYTSEDAPELTRDLDWLEGECAAFAKDYEGKLGELDADGLLTCVQRNEKINTIAGRIMSFAGLRYYQLTTDADRAKFLSDMQEKITVFTTPLVFFTLEINRIDDDILKAHFAENADLARYEPVFRRIRAMKPYQLSDELEKFLHDMGVVGDAWERLFDETIAGLIFTVDGEELNFEATANLLTEPDRKKREAAAHEMARVFQDNIKIFARVHNTQAKEKEVEDRWRNVPTPQTGRHLSNDVEPEVVEA
ncbi:MAG: oligoendopeptidase F, partial [Pseudomonadota bacterium]